MWLSNAPLLAAGIAAGLAGVDAAPGSIEPGSIARNASEAAKPHPVARRSILDFFRGKPDEDDFLAADTMLLFPAIAYPSNGSSFALDLHAVAFRHTEKPARRMRAVRRLVQSVLPTDLSPTSKDIFHKRFAPFLSRPAVGSSALVDLTIRGSGVSAGDITMPEFPEDGHLEVPMLLSTVKAGDRVSMSAKAVDPGETLPNENPVKCEAEVIVAGAEGFAVISDIDDTIKISNVLSKQQVLVQTFFNEFQPTNTMASLYAYMNRNLKVATPSGRSDPVFYYLSASPWQLFTPIMSFLRQIFPPGELILSKFDTSNPMSLLGFSNVQEYKITNGLALLDKFPSRKFILVGDSGQRDPEVYSELYSKRPDQIACILIRRVSGTDAEQEVALNDRIRFEDTMKSIPREKWVVFDVGSALVNKVDFKTSCGSELGVVLQATNGTVPASDEKKGEEGTSFLDTVRWTIGV